MNSKKGVDWRRMIVDDFVRSDMGLAEYAKYYDLDENELLNWFIDGVSSDDE